MASQDISYPKSKTKARRANFSTLTLGTWNVRGLRPKILDIEEFLEKKDVDICALQETKTDEILDPENNYKRILFERSSKYLGLGFLVKNSVNVTDKGQLDDRTAYITVRKKTEFKAKPTPSGVKIFRVKRKVSELVLYNIHAPHMGTTKKSPEITEKFYGELNNLITKAKGKDICLLGDFNAKLGKSDTKFSCVGTHSRGFRNENGDYLIDLLMKNNLIACNTFFKHRACHITFQQKKGNNTIYNQIDYILLRQNRKHSMINARSHINDRIDSDHRLVTTTIHKKIDFQRNKKTIAKKPSLDEVIKNLSDQQKSLRQKIYQSDNISKIIQWKKERAIIQRKIKIRQAEIMENNLKVQAEELNSLTGPAKLSEIFKKMFK